MRFEGSRRDRVITSQAGLDGHNLTSHDDRRIHFSERHHDQVGQPDARSRHLRLDPQRRVTSEHSDENDEDEVDETDESYFNLRSRSSMF